MAFMRVLSLDEPCHLQDLLKVRRVSEIAVGRGPMLAAGGTLPI
jgi:hypothetical protein